MSDCRGFPHERLHQEATNYPISVEQATQNRELITGIFPIPSP
ncbi:hypothetical protein [Moorena sp. SIO3H5]|nr:hypothetical protein [Moorena sp. SIO3H5]